MGRTPTLGAAQGTASAALVCNASPKTLSSAISNSATSPDTTSIQTPYLSLGGTSSKCGQRLQGCPDRDNYPCRGIPVDVEFDKLCTSQKACDVPSIRCVSLVVFTGAEPFTDKVEKILEKLKICLGEAAANPYETRDAFSSVEEKTGAVWRLLSLWPRLHSRLHSGSV